ncbi:hypothetical protein KEM52_006256 [Ascosphaera acerosa]|nr:hypothetical protein KEM52_006256 [Ascosphaera acerosa]
MDAASVAQSAAQLAARHAHHHDECGGGNEYDGRVGVRVSAIFVIMVASALGSILPVWTRPPPPGTTRKRHRFIAIPDWCFFICKYFGTGVIIATAFIHLLAEAQEKLESECLDGPITEYPWTFGIALMTIIVLFYVEFLTLRFASRRGAAKSDLDAHTEKAAAAAAAGVGAAHDHHGQFISGHAHAADHVPRDPTDRLPEQEQAQAQGQAQESAADGSNSSLHGSVEKKPRALEAGRARGDTDISEGESYSSILTGLFVLEFGIIFHSIFIGLTLAVTGSDEFNILYVVLTFHQLFEGLGLGSRLATCPWPGDNARVAYLLAGAFSLTTPIAIAIGMGVRHSYPPNSKSTLMTEGIFNSISGGILLYTGLVELLAHEFIFSPHMQKVASLREVLSAFFLIAAGTALMAMLGKWA